MQPSPIKERDRFAMCSPIAFPKECATRSAEATSRNCLDAPATVEQIFDLVMEQTELHEQFPVDLLHLRKFPVNRPHD